jgi:hypothetical protein
MIKNYHSERELSFVLLVHRGLIIGAWGGNAALPHPPAPYPPSDLTACTHKNVPSQTELVNVHKLGTDTDAPINATPHYTLSTGNGWGVGSNWSWRTLHHSVGGIKWRQPPLGRVLVANPFTLTRSCTGGRGGHNIDRCIISMDLCNGAVYSRNFRTL